MHAGTKPPAGSSIEPSRAFGWLVIGILPGTGQRAVCLWTYCATRKTAGCLEEGHKRCAIGLGCVSEIVQRLYFSRTCRPSLQASSRERGQASFHCNMGPDNDAFPRLHPSEYSSMTISLLCVCRPSHAANSTQRSVSLCLRRGATCHARPSC